MAENILINGTTYNDVKSVELNTTEGKKVLFFQGQPVTVVQETGSDEAAVMSQAAVTNALDALSNEKVDQSDLEIEVADQLDGMKVDVVQEVLAQINGEAGSVFGKVNDDGTITITTDLAEGDYTLMYENNDGSLTEIGTITVGAVAVYYTIARTLANCQSTKSETTIEEGRAWTETITANDGYELSNVVVTMGGTDVTSTVYADGVITISAVTGDVVITATATEIAVEPDEPYTNLFDVNGAGYEAWDGSKMYTNWIPYKRTDNDNYGTIYHIKGWVINNSPYKFQFANPSYESANLIYSANANQKALVVADYDSSVKLLQYSNESDSYAWIRFEFREDVAANLIITANENIVDA